MDAADLANDVAQDRLDRILQSRQPQAVGVSAVECIECGFDIPNGRREALPGVQTCVDCASIIALQNRFKGEV